MQVAQGQTWQGGMLQLPEQLTMEDLVAMVQRLTPGVSAIPTVAQGLHSLESRACAALLKDLSKNGLPHHALTIFDWLQSLPSENELSSLCDVFTYTTGMTQLVAQLQPSKHHKPCAPFGCEQLTIIHILVFIVSSILFCPSYRQYLHHQLQRRS